MPCCAATCHTLCYFQKVQVTEYYYQMILTCPFCTTDTNIVISQQHEIHEPELVMTPALRADLKKVKTADTAERKGLTALRSVVHAAALGFKAQAAPLIASLKAMQREAILNAKLTEGWRQGIAGIRRATTTRNWFTKIYGSTALRSLGVRIRRSWRNRPSYLIRRKFRVRL